MRIMILVLVVMLAACSSDKADEAPPESESPFSDLHKPIDKAEDVERQIMEQKARMDAALDAADRDVEPERD